MTALGQRHRSSLSVSSKPGRIDRIRGGAVEEDRQVEWIGDNVRFEQR
jgi:hypothetical protein